MGKPVYIAKENNGLLWVGAIYEFKSVIVIHQLEPLPLHRSLYEQELSILMC